MSIPSKDISGSLPEIILANSLPEPADIVHPRVPCPVFKYKLEYGVCPMIGVASGVLGLKPVQKLNH